MEKKNNILIIAGIILIGIILYSTGAFIGLFSVLSDSDLNMCELRVKYTGQELDCNPQSFGYGQYISCQEGTYTWLKFTWFSESAYVDSFYSPIYDIRTTSTIGQIRIIDLSTNQETILKQNFYFDGKNPLTFNFDSYLLKQGNSYRIYFNQVSCTNLSKGVTFRFLPSKAIVSSNKDYTGYTWYPATTTGGVGYNEHLIQFNIIGDEECFVGDTKCNSITNEYYTCFESEWLNQGLINGKCGYNPEGDSIIEGGFCNTPDYPERKCACGSPTTVKKVFNLEENVIKMNYNLTYTGYGSGYVKIFCGPNKETSLLNVNVGYPYINLIKNVSLDIPLSCIKNNQVTIYETFYLSCRVPESEKFNYQYGCINGNTKCSANNFLVCENNVWVDKGLVGGQCGIICTAGQEKCEGTTYYTCSNYKWVSSGQVAGKCGYSFMTREQLGIYISQWINNQINRVELGTYIQSWAIG